MLEGGTFVSRTTLLIVASMVGNVMLATALFHSRTGHPAADELNEASSPSGAATAAQDHVAPRDSDPSNPTNYFRRLRALGLSTEETKLLLLSSLEKQLLSSVQPTLAERYWESDATEKHLSAELELVGRRDAVRTTLISIYGPEAEHDPLLKGAFRPLDQRYAFLSSAEQVALQKYQLRRQLDQVAERGATPIQAPPSRTNSSGPTDQQSMSEMSEFLDSESLAEFLYRYSPLAEQIRSARVPLNENEFRRTFQELQRLNQEGSQATAYLEVRDALRGLLGTDRLTRLWAARDPLFAALQSSARQLGLTEEKTLAAYQVLTDSQEAVTKAATLRGAEPERSRAQLQSAVNSQRERLASLLGEDIAQQVLRIQSELGVRLSGQGAGNRRPPVTREPEALSVGLR
jgi:hypothetical protein